MYCPNCGSSNTDTTKFCRTCGANLSLVPQALSGQLPEADNPDSKKDFEQGSPSRLSNGISKSFVGLAFLIVAIALWISKEWWGVWMLIPAFSLLGKGVAEVVASRYGQPSLPTTPHRSMPVEPRAPESPRRTTGELTPPPSVTEHTTRQLNRSTDPQDRG